jgi:hypothetical protein
MSNGPKVRAHIHDAIQNTVAIDDGLPEGSMLMGWVTIAEWMAPDGERWLSIIDGTATPDKACPAWQRQGYLHNALFDAADFIPDDEDEDEDHD